MQHLLIPVRGGVLFLKDSFLRAMLPYFRQVAGLLTVGSLGGLVMNTAVVLPAVFLGRLIDTAMAWGKGQATGRQVLIGGAAYAGVVALYQGARLIKRWGMRMANQRILASIRANALRGVLHWPAERFWKIPIGDLMARIFGDAQVVIRGTKEMTTEMWDTVVFSISLIVGMLVYDPFLTLLALIPVPLGMLLAKAVGRLVGTRTTAMREASAAVTAFLQEHLTGRLQPVYAFLMTMGVVFVIWIGGGKVAAGAISLGVFIAYLELYTRFVGRGHRVPQLFNSIQSAVAAYGRLEPLLTERFASPASFVSTLRPYDVPGIRKNSTKAPERPPGPYSVSVQDLTFRYPGSAATVLSSISLDIPAGSLVAVTGPVGSGKSSLARVLLGLYPAESGQVLLEGEPLGELSGKERASRIGYLPQNPFLFSGTITENVLLSASPAEIPLIRGSLPYWIHLSALEEDIRDFTDGFDTLIGEQGIRVSGGQRQRIALARALAVRPGVLVLDDPFSSVDVDTEAQIIMGLKEAFGPEAPFQDRATIVFFSHRLAAFPLADMVVVLKEGCIEEKGHHADLAASGGLYSRIFRDQLSIERRRDTPEKFDGQ
jgi:ABC-type multidrug transport system fused ATPase/permease subunit